MWSRIVREIQDVFRFRWVVFSMVSATLRMRYRRSLLGFGWSMAGPMLNYLIVGIVITHASRFTVPNFLAYMLVGSAIYNFMVTGFNLGAHAMVTNENYIKKIYLPKMIYPANVISMEFINFCLQIIAIFAVLSILARIDFSWALLQLPIFIATLYIFTLGVGIILSVLSVFFRDVMHLIPIFMQASFFLTPVVYPPEVAPPFIKALLPYNPLYMMVELIRTPIYSAHSPSVKLIATAVTVAVSTLMLALVVLKSLDNRIVYKL